MIAQATLVAPTAGAVQDDGSITATLPPEMMAQIDLVLTALNTAVEDNEDANALAAMAKTTPMFAPVVEGITSRSKDAIQQEFMSMARQRGYSALGSPRGMQFIGALYDALVK